MMPSAAIKRNPHEAILEVSPLEEDGMTVPDLDQFTNCNICNCALNEDERIINYRFMKQALEAGNDISVFPLCVKCNFNNLLKGNKPNDKYDNMLTNGGTADQGAAMPLQKRVYEFN